VRVLVPVGTRPEIVKLAGVVRRVRAHGHEVRVVATGQHFDASLTDAFFEGLGLVPDERWTLPSGEAERVGEILSRAFTEMATTQPDLVLVLGDTYTVPLFCLAARRHQIPVAHLEAGLRSFNQTSMEEVNRKVAAATAAVHLAPTSLAARFLRDEGVSESRIFVVGNPVIDALVELGISSSPLEERSGILLTAHRPTNVDDPVRMAALVEIIEHLVSRYDKVTFPLHPRTRARLIDFELLGRLEATQGVVLSEPLAYEPLLEHMRCSKVVVTDSGGIQEEAAFLGVPTVVLRSSTPRWEGVIAGIAQLAGLEVDEVLAAVTSFMTPEEQTKVAATPCPYGDGTTGEQVASLLDDPGLAPLLEIAEPDLRSWQPLL
jgi:UDP-N-acetylglucosamine 2-epimerase (non-hydrolysing)